MEQYNSYKDSGVEWIGEVPSHWNICKLKHLSHIFGRIGFRGYNQTDLVGEGEGAITLSPSNMQNGKMNYDKCSYLSWYKYNESPEIKIYDGDILFVKTGSTFGKVSYVANLPMEATINPQIVVFKNIKGSNKYLYYLLSNEIVQRQVSLTVGGSTIPTLSQENILNYVVPVAPKEEQDAIASYLDKKCSEIDNVISAQQKRIALLQELKQSVITHAVTKGLNPNVEMKDSGVEWIGKIPASWDVVHLKRILREHMQYGANEPAESDDTTYPRYIRITDITANGELRPETFKSLEPSKAKDYLLDKGDVLFARSGATVGKTFLFNADIKACYAGYLIKASCDKRRMLQEYLYYYTQSGAYECWKNSVFIQSTIQNIGADKYQMMYIPVPSKDEQKQIVEYTMRKSQIFDAAISKAQHQVELLQEYKQSLITEVVTGKRKVS